jgi:dTDP-4-dehydrorhamnose reductase
MNHRKVIIGATGYIGKKLFKIFSQKAECIGTSRKKITAIQLDLNNFTNNDLKFIGPKDVLFIAAAISSPDICSKNPEYAWSVNVDGTIKIVEYAINVGARVIFFSSDTVYGERFDECYEYSDISPLGFYASMKSEVERKFLNIDGFKSIRLSYVFSYRDKFTQYLIDVYRRNDVAEVFDSLARPVIHIEDVANGLENLCDNWCNIDSNIINFGGDAIYTRFDMAKSIKKLYLHDLKIKKVSPDDKFFENRPRTINMKSNILVDMLGYRPKKFNNAVRKEFEGAEI